MRVFMAIDSTRVLPPNSSWTDNLSQEAIFRYNKRKGKTINNVIKKKCGQPGSKNYGLYQKALQSGQTISMLTHKGEVVVLAKKTGEELFAAFIGCILFGRIPLVVQRPSSKVHQSFFDKRMNDLKESVTVSLCLCEAQDIDKYAPHFKCVSELSPSPVDETCLASPSPDEIAFLQMSSGTTGVSKICEVSHEQTIAQCEEYGLTINMNETKSVISWLPLYHDMGLIAAFILPLLHGAEFHIIDPFDWLVNPKVLLEMIDKYKGTHMWMPSFAFNYMSKKVNPEKMKHLNLSSMERAISCSEPTFIADLQRFGQTFAPLGLSNKALCVCYALAENIFAVSQSDDIKTHEWKGSTYASCGKIIPGVSVVVVKNGEEVTDTDDGTVMIRSMYEPRTNKRSDFYGYYNTGDIGFIYNGDLYIIGREKDMFVSYGVNVYPEMIEYSISNFEGVVPGRVVCFGELDKDIGTNKVIVLAESENVDDNKLRTELSTIIKEDFNLTAIVKLVAPGSLIKTSSGKFCRIKNKEQYGKSNVTAS